MVAPYRKIDAQVHRDAKLALLKMLAMLHIERTDASVQKVERALTRFVESNKPTDRRA
jgi:hypothetical protein